MSPVESVEITSWVVAEEPMVMAPASTKVRRSTPSAAESSSIVKVPPLASLTKLVVSANTKLASQVFPILKAYSVAEVAVFRAAMSSPTNVSSPDGEPTVSRSTAKPLTVPPPVISVASRFR